MDALNLDFVFGFASTAIYSVNKIQEIRNRKVRVQHAYFIDRNDSLLYSNILIQVCTVRTDQGADSDISYRISHSTLDSTLGIPWHC